MSHGPNRYRAEKLKAERAVERGGATDPRTMTRAKRIISAWNAQAQRGKPAEFFPTFATALTAGYCRLTYWCPACRQMATIDVRDFADAHHSRAPISVLIPKLSCKRCCPNPPLAVLIELGSHANPMPTFEPVCVEQHSAPPPPEALPPVPTMEDLPLNDVTHINVWCGKWPYPCSHHGRLRVGDIDLRQTIVQFAAKLKCPKCGTKGGQAMPHWPNDGGGPGNAHNHSRVPLTGETDVPTSPPVKRRSRKAR